MTSLRLEDLAQYSDTLRARSGEKVTVRFVEPGDAQQLQNYYGSLSTRSRYNRFLGAMSELPKSVLDRFTHVSRDDGFTVVATVTVDGFETIVGEARYAFHAETRNLELGLSIDDRWQGRGIGAALLKNLECRAAAFGATGAFGDTLRSNDAMLTLARKAGFSLHNHPDDWRLVRFEKKIRVEPIDIPCASWRLAAEVRRLAAA
jgi:GNAT superfamily N-acetyltransferase